MCLYSNCGAHIGTGCAYRKSVGTRSAHKSINAMAIDYRGHTPVLSARRRVAAGIFGISQFCLCSIHLRQRCDIRFGRHHRRRCPFDGNRWRFRAVNRRRLTGCTITIVERHRHRRLRLWCTHCCQQRRQRHRATAAADCRLGDWCDDQRPRTTAATVTMSTSTEIRTY